jgi:hypothetical protein
MKWHSDFYLAGGDAAARAGPAMSARDDCTKHPVTPLEISILWAIIQNREWHPKALAEFPIFSVRDGTAWIHKIPASFVVDLAALSEEQIFRVAELWKSTPEMARHSEGIQVIVAELVRLALRARQSHRDFFMCWRPEMMTNRTRRAQP